VKLGVRLKVPEETAVDDREIAVKCIDTLSLKLRDKKSLEDEVGACGWNYEVQSLAHGRFSSALIILCVPTCFSH